MKRCPNCRRNAATRARGLCTRCYLTPGVLARYPAKTNQYVTGPRAGDFYGGYRPPAKPTPAMPGTEAKMQALAERVANRVALWHHQDADGGD